MPGGRAVVEAEGQVQGEEQRQQRDDEGADGVGAAAGALRDEGEHDRSDQRGEDDQRQDDVVHVHAGVWAL